MHQSRYGKHGVRTHRSPSTGYTLSSGAWGYARHAEAKIIAPLAMPEARRSSSHTAAQALYGVVHVLSAARAGSGPCNEPLTRAKARAVCQVCWRIITAATKRSQPKQAQLCPGGSPAAKLYFKTHKYGAGFLPLCSLQDRCPRSTQNRSPSLEEFVPHGHGCRRRPASVLYR